VASRSDVASIEDREMTRRLLLLLAAAFALTAAPLAAHDMWIEPTTFVPDPRTIVGVRFRVGVDLLGDPLPRDPSLIDEFVVEDADGRRPVVGRAGSDPAGVAMALSPGLLVIGYHSHPSAVDLPAETFNQYVKEEGLDAIAALRQSRGQSAAGVHEIFSRCPTSLVLAGAPPAAQGDRTLGFTLELVAERNPYRLAPGQELPVRLTYEGQPLAGVLVAAVDRTNPSDKLTARSDKDGRVRFRLPRSGMWLIKAVHMIPAPAAAHADWQSFWASLTFELPEGGQRASR
jgi:uncharacterized GH25 family protein